MSQNSSNDKAAMLAKIATINQVDGFDPEPFAVDYTDLANGEKRKRLPVMIQMAWFRMKYPEGRIAVRVSAAKDCFVATARVYPNYRDPADCYLAEATASRGYCEEKPSVSPREWAQTAAVGVALRNAGFGLQFAIAGEEFENQAVDELGIMQMQQDENADASVPGPGAEGPQGEEYATFEMPPREMTMEEKIRQAMQVLCPLTKYQGRTLGEVLQMEPGAIKWIATKYNNDASVKAAAQLICEYATQQASA